MAARDILRYFIYPIHIQIQKESLPHDCLVIFHKQNPEASVPAGYQILLKYSDHALLAVKR